jgi:hypothetical protein
VGLVSRTARAVTATVKAMTSVDVSKRFYATNATLLYPTAIFSGWPPEYLSVTDRFFQELETSLHTKRSLIDVGSNCIADAVGNKDSMQAYLKTVSIFCAPASPECHTDFHPRPRPTFSCTTVIATVYRFLRGTKRSSANQHSLIHISNTNGTAPPFTLGSSRKYLAYHSGCRKPGRELTDEQYAEAIHQRDRFRDWMLAQVLPQPPGRQDFYRILAKARVRLQGHDPSRAPRATLL